MANTRIYVISMASAAVRRAEFTAQASAARSEWRFVDAHTTLEPPLRYDEPRAVRRFGRALTAGELGCYASHYAAWRDLVTSGDEQRLVLEDDVLADWPTIDRLLCVNIASFGLDLVRLYATHPFQYRTAINRFLGPHIHLVQVRGMFLGAQGYLLTRNAAQRLLDLGAEVLMPVDWLMCRYWEYGFPNYCVFPFPIIEKCIPSNIGERAVVAPRSTAERLARVGFRVADRISRGYADLVRFRRHPFGETPDEGPAFVDRYAPPARETAATGAPVVFPNRAEIESFQERG